MISESSFAAVFGSVPAGDETSNLVNQARAMIRAGYAVVLSHPGTKKPLCTFNSIEANRANTEARENARAEGHRRWDAVTHPCGIAHAITDEKESDRVIKRLTKDGARVNLGVELRRSRVVVVDVDTAEEDMAFHQAWLEATGEPIPFGMSVRSPGVYGDEGESGSPESWKHKNGGHYWFTLPEGFLLPSHEGVLTMPGGWVIMWADRQVLVPPSVRREGPYELVGSDHPIPEWLLRTVLAHMVERKEQRERQAAKRAQRMASGDGDAFIDQWAAETPWSALLEPDGWVSTRMPDSCGCDIWTAPGVHASAKSATAHDVGCTDPRYDDSAGHLPLHIWTYNPPEGLEGPSTITKIQYVALRDHDGDLRLACRAMGISSERTPISPLVSALVAGGVEPVAPEATRPDPLPQPSSPSGERPGLTLVPPISETSETGGPTPVMGDFSEAMTGDPVMDAEIVKRLQFLISKERADKIMAGLRAADLELPSALTRGDEFLAGEDVPIAMRIEGLWPVGGNIMLAAQRKAGKTTMLDNLMKSLLDGDRFLNRFTVTAPGGVVARVDLEMDKDVLRADLRKQQIQNTRATSIDTLRGEVTKFNIMEDRVRAHWATLFRDLDVRVLLFDCLRPLMDALGLDENRDIGLVTQAFDALKHEAGIPDGLIVHHAGHNGERARGDSRARDWPDAEWKLARVGEDDRAPRKFSAYGRAKVDVAPALLEFDPDTHRLTLVAPGIGISASVTEPETTKHIIAVLAPLKGEKMDTKGVIEAMVGKAGQNVVREVLNANVGKVFTREKAPGRSGTWLWGLANTAAYFVPVDEPDGYEGFHDPSLNVNLEG